MSQVLALASDFIERMINPAYGIRVNEEYSLRFAELLSTEGFEDLLRSEVAQLKSPETLSQHGWLWVLGWARSKKISIDETLLLQLTESWSSIFMQVAAIDLATREAKWVPREPITSIQEFGHPWLSKLMLNCTKASDGKNMDQEYIDTRCAEMTLVALMQVGSDIALDAASSLLNHKWAGQAQLVKLFWSLCDRLDDETQELWVSRLHPPEI